MMLAKGVPFLYPTKGRRWDSNDDGQEHSDRRLTSAHTHRTEPAWRMARRWWFGEDSFVTCTVAISLREMSGRLPQTGSAWQSEKSFLPAGAQCSSRGARGLLYSPPRSRNHSRPEQEQCRTPGSRSADACWEASSLRLRSARACREPPSLRLRSADACRESPPLRLRSADACRESPSPRLRSADACREPPSLRSRRADACRESPSLRLRSADACRESPSLRLRSAGACRESPPPRLRSAGACREALSGDREGGFDLKELLSVKDEAGFDSAEPPEGRAGSDARWRDRERVSVRSGAQ